MAQKEAPQFQFAIASVTTEQFSVTPEAFEPSQPVDLNISFDFKLSTKQQMIGTFLTVTYQQPECKLVVLRVGCHFKIHPDTWNELLDAESGQLTLPHQHALHLGTITTGTARGVLHARLTGSPFAHFVLPLINLTKVIGADIVLNANPSEAPE
jgi:hypothetical protein